MKSKTIKWMIIGLLLFGLSACSTAEPTVDLNVMNTMVAQNVQLTQMAGELTAIVAQQSATPAATNTSSATKTPRPTATETPTSTPLNGYVLTFDADTNCRLGPGTTYGRAAVVLAGTQLQAIARSEDGEFFYVRYFDTTNHYCWVWKGTSYHQGDVKTVPVFTAVPTKEPTITPTSAAGFTVVYESLQSCNNGSTLSYAPRFTITNTGYLTWQSVKITVVDSSTGTTLVHSNNAFTGYLGCSVAQSEGDLVTNEYSLVSSYNPGEFSYDPTGHTLTVTVSVFSEKNQTGTVVSRAITVTP